MPRGYSRPDGAVPCPTDFIYLYLFEPVFLPPLSLALITLITCFLLSIRQQTTEKTKTITINY